MQTENQTNNPLHRSGVDVSELTMIWIDEDRIMPIEESVACLGAMVTIAAGATVMLVTVTTNCIERRVS